MKVTAILPDELIQEVKMYSGGKNITDSLEKALSEWLKLAKLKELNRKLSEKPLEFKKGISAFKIREVNRK
ncbi:MAG: DUF2191 domain-containing protein [Leptospira sp.]|jgi:hypothetical protein|nr:DUF2191 domain-containing protein [Leptospira sp.]